MTCAVDGCSVRVRAKGLCTKHYHRVRRSGTTDLLPRKNAVPRLDSPDAEGRTFAAADPRHGTSNGYTNLDCRCRRCKAAWRLTHRAYMHRDPEHLKKHAARERARRLASSR